MSAPPPELLLAAYSQGVFPMADDSGAIYWFDPEPRAVLPLERFHVPTRLARTVRQRRYTVHINRAFAEVIRGCAAPAPGRRETWLSDEMVDAYVNLNGLGFAHSVETWRDGELAGGLYGVAINSFFAGESMFSDARDASKVALVHLVRRLQRRNFLLLDIQYLTPHLSQFGAVEIPRAVYKRRLARALAQSNSFA